MTSSSDSWARLPRWVLVVAWVVVVGRIVAAAGERFATEAMARALLPDSPVTAATQMFAARVASREAALAVGLAAALLLRDTRVVGALLAVWAGVETLDWIQGVVEILDGTSRQYAFAVPLLPVLLAVAARAALTAGTRAWRLPAAG